MAAKRTIRARILDELRAAPAFPLDIATEIGITPEQAVSQLGKLAADGKIARRMFYSDSHRPRYLYMLRAHAALMTDNKE